MRMDLYGENNSGGGTTSTNTSNINGVFCPMMFMTSSSTTNTSSPISNYHLTQLPATTTANDGVHRSPAARGLYVMDTDGGSGSSVRAKIMSHPHYPRLLAAYANCQKVI